MGGQLYNQTIDWTDRTVQTLKTMWAAGSSHSQIAAVIPGASRSAIAGKIMRLKLPAREHGRLAPRAGIRLPRLVSNLSPSRPSAPKAPPQPAAENFTHRRSAATNLAERIEVADEPLRPILRGEAPDGTGIQLCDLSELNCHWPKGDPLEADFEFCGAKAIPGTPYCAHHCRVSYTPAQDRRRAQSRI